MKGHKLMILGRSGSGKSAGMRNLDPAKTGVINADLEPFPFKMDGYQMVMDGDKPDLLKSNYVETVRPNSAVATLKAWDERDDLDTIVLDTFTHLLTNYYVNFCLGQPYSGYKELGTAFFSIMEQVNRMQKNVIVFGHINTQFNDAGDLVVEMKSHGKMIKEFEPESYFNILLYSEVIKDEKGIKRVFRTQPKNPSESVKSPAMFNEDGSVTPLFDEYIDNDISAVIHKLDEFYNHKLVV